MLSLRSPMSLGVALGAGLVVSALTGLPAQAQQNPCGSGFIPGSTIFTSGFSCFIGDKLYSNFALDTDTTGQLATSSFSFGQTIFPGQADNYRFSAVIPGGYNPGIYVVGYTVTVLNAGVSGQRISSIRSASLSDQQPIGGVPAWTKTLEANAPSISQEILYSTNQSGNTINVPPPSSFSEGVTTANFISTLIVGPGTVANSFSDSIIQNQSTAPPSSAVPGPLPILGASAAFGMSRKLRRRIKQTA